MAVIYDIDIKPPNDYYFNLAEEAMRQASAVVLSNSTQVVNAFPALLRLPRWVPGIGFQKAAAAGKLIAEMKEGTFEYALNQMVCVTFFVKMRDPEFPVCRKKGTTPH
jgi:hypothetical protein